MPWGRCDDGFWSHDKVRSLDRSLRLPCVGLFWMAVSYANKYLTDGAITADDIRRLGGSHRQVAELVRVGLWDTDDAGWYIHDFLDFNRSKSQVLSQRDEMRDRKRASRGSSLARPVTRIPLSIRDDYAALARAGKKLTEARKRVLDEVLDRHDVTGPAWAAAIIDANPDDPIGAVMRADAEYKAAALAAAEDEDRAWRAAKEEDRRSTPKVFGVPA